MFHISPNNLILFQVLINSQQQIGSQRDNQKSQYSDLRHKLEEIGRKYERSERASSSLVDEFRQLKSKLDIQVRYTLNAWDHQ